MFRKNREEPRPSQGWSESLSSRNTTEDTLPNSFFIFRLGPRSRAEHGNSVRGG